MQGGAYCFDEPSCDDRLNTLPEKTTSIGIAQTETGYGILSSDINSNPQYYDANHIDIAYCSSDLWTGNNTAENNDVEIRGETWNWLGAHILHTALAYTVAELGMDTATEIVLAGRTSGGVGNLVNLPTTGPMVEAMVPAAKVYGLIDSGWVVDMEPYANQSCVNVDECSVTTGVQLANEMWQPEISAACLEQYTYESGEFYKCYQALYAFEFITIPTMVIENQADPVQLTNLACANPTTDEEIEFAIEVAAKVVEEVISGAAVENFWMPSCMVHGTLDQAYWNDIYMPDSDSDEAHLIDVPAGIELFDGGSGGIALYDICPEDDPFMCGNCP
jgi:hypothetical protein